MNLTDSVRLGKRARRLAGSGIQSAVTGFAARERNGEQEQKQSVAHQGVGDLEWADAEELASTQPFPCPRPKLLQVGARVCDPGRYSEVQIAKPQREARGNVQAREMSLCPDVSNLRREGFGEPPHGFVSLQPSRESRPRCVSLSAARVPPFPGSVKSSRVSARPNHGDGVWRASALTPPHIPASGPSGP